MEYFKDKIVWVTGVSSGFGESLSYALAFHGAKLILSARRQNELDKVKSHIPTADILILDLEKTDSFPEIVEQAINIHGRIDIMIHNGRLLGSILPF